MENIKIYVDLFYAFVSFCFLFASWYQFWKDEYAKATFFMSVVIYLQV